VDGKLHITLCNLSVEESYPIEVALADTKAKAVQAEILTGKMDAKNTFEAKETVKPEIFDGVVVNEEGLQLTIPACSVMHIAVEI
jgi:alpha-N-arabinofuranosidase